MSALEATRYGVASPAEVAGMTGKEMLQAIIDGRLPTPPIAGLLDFPLSRSATAMPSSRARRANGSSIPSASCTAVGR